MDRVILSVIGSAQRRLVNRSSVTMFIIYEDDPTSAEAVRAEAELSRRLETGAEMRTSWWKLRFLTHPSVMALATESLRKADVVLVSLSLNSDLPLIMRGWLESELGKRGGPQCAVLALLELGKVNLQQPSATHALLRAVAECGKRSFLHQPMASS